MIPQNCEKIIKKNNDILERNTTQGIKKITRLDSS